MFEGSVIVRVIVSPFDNPVIWKLKNPCGKVRLGLPVAGRVDSFTAVRLPMTPAPGLKVAEPVPVDVSTEADVGFTSNELLVPDLLSPDVVMTTPVWDWVIVTLPVHDPDENVLVEVGLIVPVESLNVFVPV